MSHTNPILGLPGWGSTLNTALDSLELAAMRPTFKLPQLKVTPVFSGEAGHTISGLGSAGTFDLNDTTDFVLGTRAVKGTTDGAGGLMDLGSSALSFDMTSKCPVVWLKVEGAANILDFNIWAADSNFSNSYQWSLEEGSNPFPYLATGQWVKITLPFGHATVGGSPTRSAMTCILVQMVDKGTGSVTVHLGGYGLVSDIATKYPNGAVSVTFDDGLLTQYTTARPYLDKLGLPATAYLICQTLYDHGSGNFNSYFDLTQAHKLQDYNNWEIGAHAYTAANHNTSYTGLDSATQLLDMVRAKGYLIDNGFTAVDHLAYPLGAVDTTVAGNASKVFSSARSLNFLTDESLPPAQPLRLRAWAPSNATTLQQMKDAVDQAKAGKEWLVFTFHDIVTSPSTSLQVSTSNFQALMDYIVASSVPCVPISEALRASWA